MRDDDDPAALSVAEDMLIATGQSMRAATGGAHARNFTIELTPLWKPRDEWKMVQVTVAPAVKGRRMREPKVGYATILLHLANGAARLNWIYDVKVDLDEAKRQAVATAWAIAKVLKVLPLDTPQKAVFDLANTQVKLHKKHSKNQELY